MPRNRQSSVNCRTTSDYPLERKKMVLTAASSMFLEPHRSDVAAAVLLALGAIVVLFPFIQSVIRDLTDPNHDAD